MCNVRTFVQVICVSLIVFKNVSGFSFGNNITRIRRQASDKCHSSTDFSCKSGECIDLDKECDGAVDCPDESDESDACHRIKCPAYLFKCRYGACINPEMECDGKRDCRDGSDENTSSPRCKKEISTKTCNNREFQCSSGQCIDSDLKCDGQADCNDQSDEISATCWDIKCPGFTYRCKYGACVDGNALCNGKVECYDGSDEDSTVCKTSPTQTPPTVRPTSSPTPSRPPPTGNKGSCILPDHPDFGQWSIYGFPGQTEPGTPVDSGTILQVSCKLQHKLEGSESTFCRNGVWSNPIGQCIKTCPSIFNTDTLTVTCTYNGGQTVNCTDPVDGTLARYKCAFFYEDPALDRNPTDLCRDGSWTERKPVCTPVCGRRTGVATPLIINGKPVERGNYPWQVALFSEKDKDLICGGSLISQKIVLTAAHCVTDKTKLLPKENYIVAVGKYYRKFNDSRDANEAQFSELQAMFIPETYKGYVRFYVGDIAILICKRTFSLSQRVQPVCLDRGLNFEQRLLDNNPHGYVTGWGYTQETGEPSEVLKELEVPLVSYTRCDQSLPEDFQSYLTPDKLCAGYLDNSTAVCSGDSGGGLVFKHEGRFFITGIVSLSPQSTTTGHTCDSQLYGLYTRVSFYMNDFILNKESQFKLNL